MRMSSWKLVLPLLAMAATLFTGCGGVSRSKVYSIKLTPNVSISLNSGDVTTITAVAYDSDGNKLSSQPTFYYSSGDASAVTITTTGSVCGGIWDAALLNCRNGSAPAGPVTITVSAKDTTVTATLPVYVHPKPTRIDLTGTPAIACASQGAQIQFGLNAVYTHYVAGSSTPVTETLDPTTLGTVTWTSSDTTVASVNTTGAAVSVAPGVSNIYATVGSVTSSPMAFVSCPVASISLLRCPSLDQYANCVTDANTIGRTYAKGDTEDVVVSFADTKGNSVTAAPITYNSSNPLSATIVATTANRATLTAADAGPFTILATCTPTTCNNAEQTTLQTPAGTFTPAALGFNRPIYSNPFTGTVSGTSATTVLVTGLKYTDGTTSNFQLKILESGTLSEQATIPLTYAANSIVVDAKNSKAYLGGPIGLTVVDLTASTATSNKYTVSGLVDAIPIPGRVVGLNSDRTKVFVVDETNSRTFVVNISAKTAGLYSNLLVASVSTSPDAFRTLVTATSPSDATKTGVYEYSDAGFIFLANDSMITSAVTFSPEGNFAAASGAKVEAFATCSDAPISSLTTNPADFTSMFLDNANNAMPRLIGVSSSAWLDMPVTVSNTSACPPTLVSAPVPATYTGSCTPTGFHMVADGSYAFAYHKLVTSDPSPCSTVKELPYYKSSGSSAGTFSFVGSGYPIAVSSTLDSQYVYIGTSDGTVQVFQLPTTDFPSGRVIRRVDMEFIPEVVAVVPK